MRGWVKASALTCIPQIFVVSTVLTGGDSVLRTLIVGLLLDLFFTHFFKTHIAYLLASLLAEYLLYVAFRTHNLLVFKEVDVFAFTLTIGACFSIMLLALLISIGDEMLSLPKFFAYCFSSSLVMAFSFISISSLIFGVWYPIILACLLPLCRVYYEVLIVKGLNIYDTSDSLFKTGFGVTSSDETGARGVTMHTGFMQANKAKRAALSIGGFIYICMSYVVPIFCLFFAQPISLLLAIPLCVLIATVMLSFSAVVIYLLKKGLYLRELSPQVFKPGYVRFADRARDQPQLFTVEDSTDGKEKAANNVLRRRLAGLKVALFLLVRKPNFGDLVLAPFIFLCILSANLVFLSRRMALFLLPTTLIQAYFSSRCTLTGNSTALYILLLASPLLSPFTPAGNSLLCTLYVLSLMTEGKQFGAYALLAAEYAALTVNMGASTNYFLYFILHLIYNAVLSSTAFPTFSESLQTVLSLSENLALPSSALKGSSQTQQYQKIQHTIKMQAIIHAISIFFVTLYSRTRGAAFLSCLVLVSVTGYYCSAFLNKHAGNEFSMKLFLIAAIRSIFMVLISLVNTGKLRHIGYRIRESYLLLSFSCFVLLFILLFIPFAGADSNKASPHYRRNKVARVSITLVSWIVSILLLVFANVTPLFCTGFLMMIGYIPQGDPSLLLLTVYRSFHSSEIENYITNSTTLIVLRWVLTAFVGALILASLLLGFDIMLNDERSSTESEQDNAKGLAKSKYAALWPKSLNIRAVLISLIVALLVGLFLLAPSLIYVYGSSSSLTMGKLFISLLIVGIIAFAPFLAVPQNPVILFSVTITIILALLLILTSYYPVTILYVSGLVLTMTLPASLAGICFVTVCMLPELLNNAAIFYVSQDYILSFWVACALAFICRLWFNRELYIRMALYYLVEQGRTNPAIRVKASNELLDSLWLVCKQFQSESDGNLSIRKNYLYYWIGGLTNGFWYLQINISLFIATSCILLSDWNYSPIVVVLLSLVSLLIPAVDFTPSTTMPSLAFPEGLNIRAIGGYFGTGGTGFSFSDNAKLQLTTNICIALYGSIILRCLYSIIRAPFHLSSSSINAKGYAIYLFYDLIALVICSMLSLIPFTLLTGLPYRLFTQLQNIQKQKLLLLITALICFFVFFATEKSMIFFIILSSLAMLFEAPLLAIQQHNKNKEIIINGKMINTVGKNVVTMDIPAIVMNN